MTGPGRVGGAAGIAVGDIRDEYVRRGVADWSDRRLAAEVAAVVSVPRHDPANSFVLHAPLELEARMALLPWIEPSARELARLHILAIAAQYEAFGPPVEETPPSPASLPGSVDPAERLIEALGAGDLDEIDRAATAVAEQRPTPAELTADVVDAVVDSTSAAAHAPIFFFHLGRVAERGEIGADLLRPLVRELGRRPDRRIRWIEHHRPTAPTDPERLAATLGDLPRLGLPGADFIAPLMAQVDGSDEVVDLLHGAVGTASPEAGRAVLRVAARSMLAEPPDHARYGWTHCLTMPQAVIGTSEHSTDPDRMLAVAATHVAGFRVAEATVPLPPLELDALPEVDVSRLVTEAATFHDAHVVKYTLGCLDAAAMDPSHARLYLAAARRLLDIWAADGGDPTDPLAP